MERQSIWAHLLGRVQCSVQGGDTARFLNLCTDEGLTLSHLRADPLGFTCWLPARQYRLLRAPARRCRCKVQLLRRVGVAFTVARLAKRRGVLAGMLAFLLLWQWACGVIWTVSYYRIPAQQAAVLAPYLARYGLVRGAHPTDGQMERARQAILLEEERFSSLSFQFVRGRLLVEAVLAEEKPSIRDNTTPMDVVAKKNGILRQLQVYSGFAVRKVGQSVAEGDILVTHSYTDPRTGNVTTGQAHAQVLAETETVFCAAQPLSFTETVLTGAAAERYSIGMGVHLLPLYFKEVPPFSSSEKQTALLPVTVWGFALPVYLVRECYRETAPKTVTLTEEQAKLRAKAACDAQIRRQLADASILWREERFSAENGEVILQVRVGAVEEIGVQAAPVPTVFPVPEEGA